MRIPLSWLNEFTAVPTDLKELASTCDMAGLEVATIDVVGENWNNIVIGEVLSAELIEGTHLHAVRIDTGSHGEKHSVCGAPNMGPQRVGDKVAAALEGAVFQFTEKDGSRGELTVEARRVQGHASEAVLCSERELGMSDEHGGIFFADKAAVAGTPIAELYTDQIIEFELTPDLGRCFSVFGTAREIAALYELDLDRVPLQRAEVGASGSGSVPVSIDTPNLCNRYLGAVLHNVTVGPSPEWMQRRLIGAGLRPLNNIVDISNYVLLEMGQPLHFFDLNTLQGPAITVRQAQSGEKLEALNGTTYDLPTSALVIADEAGPVAVAGIIGGEASSVKDHTTSVLLEAAHFNNHSVRRTTAAIKLRTDAAERFIKDVDPQWTMDAMQRAISLVLELCPGATLEGYHDAYPTPPEPTQLALTTQDVKRLLGVDLTASRIAETLTRFDFKIEEDGDTLHTTAPTYRKDVSCPADLIEEVARAYGLNNIPPASTGRSYFDQPSFGEALVTAQESVSEVLCGQGFYEAINYSMAGQEWNRFGSHFGAPEGKEIFLKNALSAHRDAMRTTLIPGLLDNVASNLRYQSGVHLFEFGRTYFDLGEDTVELDMVALIATGTRREAFWGNQDPGTAIGETFRLFDLKGIVNTLAGRLGVPALTYEALEVDSLTPGQAFLIRLNGKQIGYVGEVDPATAEAFGVEDRKVYAAELQVEPLLAQASEMDVQFTGLATQPAVFRDLSLLVSREVPVASLLDSARQAAGELLTDLQLFDRYVGKGVPEGEHSLAISLTFQHPERTLRAEEVDAQVQAVVTALASAHGATLRG